MAALGFGCVQLRAKLRELGLRRADIDVTSGARVRTLDRSREDAFAKFDRFARMRNPQRCDPLRHVRLLGCEPRFECRHASIRCRSACARVSFAFACTRPSADFEHEVDRASRADVAARLAIEARARID